MCTAHNDDGQLAPAPEPSEERRRERCEPPLASTGRVADLTHCFRAGFPVARFEAPRREAAADFASEGSQNQRWRFVEHSGTHVDAPAHFFPDLADVSQLPATDLIVPVVVIDVAARAARDADTLLEVADLRRHESRHGPIPPGAGVFMSSGWDAHAADPEQFAGLRSDGTMHSPGFSLEAVDWLVAERDIACIGVDTLSIDAGNDTAYPVHRRLLGAGRYAIECLSAVSTVPPAGATAIVGVVPWENGSGGPCRVIACW